jgi:hypothetical protein
MLLKIIQKLQIKVLLQKPPKRIVLFFSINSLLVVIYAQITSFYPGIYTWDSGDQLQQAISGDFRDWQPPMMSWVWSQLFYLSNFYPSLFLLHQVILFSAGLVWIFLVMKFHSGWLPIFVPVLLSSPILTNFSGVVWKDVGFAFALLLAVGILGHLLVSRPERKFLFFVNTLFIFFLLIYALGVRTNGLFSLIPIVLVFCWLNFKVVASSVRKMVLVLAFSTLILLGIIGILTSLTNFVIKPEKNFSFQYVQLYDLIGIYSESGEDLMPQYVKRKGGYDFQKVVEAYELTNYPPRNANHIFTASSTGKILINLSSDESDQNQLMRSWLNAIISHPIEYIKHRLNFYSNFMKGGYYTYEQRQSAEDRAAVFQQTSVNSLNPAPTPECLPGCRTFSDLFRKSHTHSIFLYSGWIWLSVLIINLMIAIRSKTESLKYLGIAVGGSGLVYLFTFFLFAAASDFRYLYWSTISASFGLIISILILISNKIYFCNIHESDRIYSNRNNS